MGGQRQGGAAGAEQRDTAGATTPLLGREPSKTGRSFVGNGLFGPTIPSCTIAGASACTIAGASAITVTAYNGLQRCIRQGTYAGRVLRQLAELLCTQAVAILSILPGANDIEV